MANDRIYIVCKYCREKAVLLKYYPSGTYLPSGLDLEDFLCEHIQCSPNFGGIDLHGDVGFDLLTEMEEGSSKLMASNEKYYSESG